MKEFFAWGMICLGAVLFEWFAIPMARMTGDNPAFYWIGATIVMWRIWPWICDRLDQLHARTGSVYEFEIEEIEFEEVPV